MLGPCSTLWKHYDIDFSSALHFDSFCPSKTSYLSMVFPLIFEVLPKPHRGIHSWGERCPSCKEQVVFWTICRTICNFLGCPKRPLWSPFPPMESPKSHSYTCLWRDLHPKRVFHLLFHVFRRCFYVYCAEVDDLPMFFNVLMEKLEKIVVSFF